MIGDDGGWILVAILSMIVQKRPHVLVVEKLLKLNQLQLPPEVLVKVFIIAREVSAN